MTQLGAGTTGPLRGFLGTSLGVPFGPKLCTNKTLRFLGALGGLVALASPLSYPSNGPADLDLDPLDPLVLKVKW